MQTQLTQLLSQVNCSTIEEYLTSLDNKCNQWLHKPLNTTLQHHYVIEEVNKTIAFFNKIGSKTRLPFSYSSKLIALRSEFTRRKEHMQFKTHSNKVSIAMY